jgi:hypothetical protein
MKESIFETERRKYENKHSCNEQKCGLCKQANYANEMGWMTLNHPNEGIAQYQPLCAQCVVRIADFAEALSNAA